MKGNNAKGTFSVNNKLIMMVESVTGAGWCEWFKKNNDFYDKFLGKMNIQGQARIYL